MIINSVLAGTGGSSVNLNVVAYSSTYPSAPNNTIGFISSTAVNGYVVSSTQPTTDLAEGLVWIKTGVVSSVPIEVSEGLTIYPVCVKQYLSGAWVTKSAKVRKNSSWNVMFYVIYEDGLSNVQLYKPSSLNLVGSSKTYYNNGVVSFDASSVLLSTASNLAAMATNVKVPLYQPYTSLSIKYTTTATKNVAMRLLSSLEGNLESSSVTIATTNLAAGTSVTATMPLSSVSATEAYVCASAVNDFAMTIHKIWLS